MITAITTTKGDYGYENGYSTNYEDKEGYENGYSNNNNYENPKDYQTYPSEYRT